MDRRQKKRILIFLIVPILAAIIFIAQDTIIKIIAIILLLIYVAFIIFLRDSIKFDTSFISSSKDEPELDDYSSESSTTHTDLSDSFEIISPNKKVEIITDQNFTPEFRVPKTILKPPDLKEKFEEIANEILPPNVGHNEQFSFVLEKLLSVIKEAYSAHSAIFFWYNKKNEKLTIEKFVSNSREINKRKFDIEDDILSKIVSKAEPELLSDITSAAEPDVIRYYNIPQAIKSFVGVPLFYDKNLIAVIALDSKDGDAFGIETIYALGRFVRVVTMIIGLYDEKHSESISQQRLESLINMIGPDNKFNDINEIVRTIETSLDSMLSWDAFTFVYFHPIDKKFRTIRVNNKTTLKYIGENLDIDLNGTLVGKAIVSGIPVKIDDTSLVNYQRYSKVEDVAFDGSFAALPLIYNEQNYGVICLENLKKNSYTNSDIKYLKGIFNFISYYIYSQSTQLVLKNLLSVDIETRALNSESFKNRINIDLFKAQKLNIPSSLALIKLDDFLEQESLFECDPLTKVIASLCESISAELSPLNLFGRLEEKIFGIYFFNSSSKEVFLWAEKFRVKFARHSIVTSAKQSTYTVSIGVASARDLVNAEEIIENASLALQKAIEKGGNSVRNIN
ncbi:MAG: GAF domain-containing protein [Ignavibacteriales bacterium]|nr:GAF domain-containing protein [Ignavibacteriales bacterium]